MPECGTPGEGPGCRHGGPGPGRGHAVSVGVRAPSAHRSPAGPQPHPGPRPGPAHSPQLGVASRPNFARHLLFLFW